MTASTVRWGGHTIRRETAIQTELNAARVFGVFASTLATLLLANISPARADTFSYDFGATCSTMTVVGRTISCNDGTTIALHSSVTPSCPQFSLTQQGTAYTLGCAT